MTRSPMGVTRRRLFGAFFFALGILLLLPAAAILLSMMQDASVAIAAPYGPIVLAISVIGGVATCVGGIYWMLGFK